MQVGVDAGVTVVRKNVPEGSANHRNIEGLRDHGCNLSDVTFQRLGLQVGVDDGFGGIGDKEGEKDSGPSA